MVTVSVIVPVYNAEKTLNQCVDSVFRQTFKDFELILIDDGSSDASAGICDEYAQTDPRVKVMHKANQGVSSARNDGLAVSCGTYITFIDADDYVSEDYLSALVKGAGNAIDFVCAAKISLYDERDVPDKGQAFVIDLTQEIGPAYYNKLAGYTSPWMKLFRRKIIVEHNIRFNPAVHYGEDTAFVYEYLCHCRCIKQISDLVYFYRVYEGSAAHRNRKGIVDCLTYRQTYFEAFIRRLQFAEPVNDILIEGFAYNGFRLLIRNALRADKRAAIEELEEARAAFGEYIRRLAERISCKESISFGGVPDSLHKEVTFLAKTTQAKRIYKYVVCKDIERKTVQRIKMIIKKLCRKM